MTDKDKLLTARIEDLFDLCEKYSAPRFSSFLDGGETAYLEDSFKMPFGFNTMFFGGFSESERTILGVFPEWHEAEESLFPISILKIEGGYNRKLTHRDYLGTMLSLGIDRSKMGDIIITEDDYAYAAVYSDIAEYIRDNIHKIGNQGVKIDIVEDMSSISPNRQFETMRAVCASMRIDAVTAAFTKMSRNDALNLVNKERVKLNHRPVNDPSKQVRIGDLISVQGFGRVILASIGEKTRSGRLHITVKKYI